MTTPHAGLPWSGREAGRTTVPPTTDLPATDLPATAAVTVADAPGGYPQPGRPRVVLPLTERVRLLTGADSWRTAASADLGLRPMVTSDGPSGVRGATLDERRPSGCLPCPSALGATWDPDLVAEVAAALGAEARAKGVDIVLAPTINLMRSPLGGRGFECFSEDPELTARIAVGYVRGLQSAGVAAAVKHFVGNDTETGRWGYDARIDAAVLRELYLAPFEACVREAGALAVMAAYNAVNGQRMTEHEELLTGVLKREWGFAGPVISDWDATRSTVATALAGLDLAMPGPNRHWGEDLLRAVRDGIVPEPVIDDKVARLVRLAAQVGALAGPADHRAAESGDAESGAAESGVPESGVPESVAADGGGRPAAGPGAVPAGAAADPGLLRRVAAASFVLLKNDREALPLDPGGLVRLAVIGPNAVYPVIQGGGSAVVSPAASPSLLEALRAALPGRAAVRVAAGCRTWSLVPAPPLSALTDPVTGEAGLRLEFRAPGGAVLLSERRMAATLGWWDQSHPEEIGWGRAGTIALRTRYTAESGGPHVIGAAGVGRLVITADDAVLADRRTAVPADPVEALARPGEVRAGLVLTVGQVVDVRVEFEPAPDGAGPLALRVGIAPAPEEDQMIEEAVTAAAGADAAVVVAGTAEAAESEGFDRDTLALAGRQNELIARVAAANPRTIVVLNAGMPVLMPWLPDVAAVLQAWLPGQEMGTALADVLLGDAEPSGRLPVTMPAAEADCPVLHAVPRDGRLDYAEGLLIGYRGYDAAGTEPMFAFGHGLGYTSWEYQDLTPADPDLAPGTDLALTVRVRNSGCRAGREVVQVYVAPGHRAPGRPVRVLGAFAAVEAGPGEERAVALRVPARAFAVFDPAAGGWTWPPGEFTIEAGRSSRDLRLSATVRSG